MIAEIFLPEKLGNRQIISKRIVGIAIQDDQVSLACVYVKRSKTVIESLNKIIITPGTEETYAQRAADALKKIIAPVKRYHKIRIAIPASIVTFKELQFPFSDLEKISMVLNYEIESMLPFDISEAVVDFIITKEGDSNHPTQVLVAAVRSQDLQAVLDIYQLANIVPTNITIDLFSAYGLYQQIPDYKNISNASALVDVGETSARIAFLHNGELRLTRTIPRGYLAIINGISEELGLTVESVQENIDLNGVILPNDEAYSRVAQKHFINFFNDIQFTLNSFSLKLSFYESIGKLIFIGKMANIPDFMKFSSDTLQVPCEVFACKKLLSTSSIKSEVKDSTIDWSRFAVALGTANPSSQHSNFDLRRKKFALLKNDFVAKQVIAGSLILFFILATVGYNGYVQISELQEALNLLNEKSIAPLKSIVDKTRQTNNLESMVKEAKKNLGAQSELWASFSPEYRMDTLSIYLELTNLLKKYRNEITINDIFISSDEKGEKEVVVNGVFKSKIEDNNWSEFGTLVKSIRETEHFILSKDPDLNHSLEDKTLSFALNFNVK